MRRPQPEADWPETWKSAYAYDRVEVFGEPDNLGHAYAYEGRRSAALALLDEALPAGASVLDIAAAQGNFSLALAERGFAVTWNDLRAELVGYVQRKYERGRIDFRPGNAFDLAFPTPFDAVLITEVIEQVAHPDRFLENAARLTRPGGVIVMTTPHGAYFRNTLPRFTDCPDPAVFESGQFKPDADGHIFLLYRDEVERLAARAGLLVERFAYLNNPLTGGHVKLGRLLPFVPAGIVRAVEAMTRRLPEVLASRLSSHIAVRFRRPAVHSA